MQACDACRRRKVKCDRTHPCLKCRVGLLRCTYHDNVKRQVTNVRIPANTRSPTSARSSSVRQDEAESVLQVIEDIRGQSEESSGNASFANPPRQRHSTARSVSPRDRLHSSQKSPRISSRMLRLHVKLFLKWMFPLWPIVRPDETLAACADVEALSAERYCFLLALCACNKHTTQSSSAKFCLRVRRC